MSYQTLIYTTSSDLLALLHLKVTKHTHTHNLCGHKCFLTKRRVKGAWGVESGRLLPFLTRGFMRYESSHKSQQFHIALSTPQYQRTWLWCRYSTLCLKGYLRQNNYTRELTKDMHWHFGILGSKGNLSLYLLKLQRKWNCAVVLRWNKGIFIQYATDF